MIVSAFGFTLPTAGMSLTERSTVMKQLLNAGVVTANDSAAGTIVVPPLTVTVGAGGSVTSGPPPVVSDASIGTGKYYQPPPGYEEMMGTKDTLPWYQGPAILVAGLGAVGALFWLGWRAQHPRQLSGYRRRRR